MEPDDGGDVEMQNVRVTLHFDITTNNNWAEEIKMKIVPQIVVTLQQIVEP